MNKLILSAAIFAAASSAQAGQFYVDAGTDFIGGGATIVNGKECDTCTSMKDEFLMKYDSNTNITDLDANGISAGDLVSTSGGLEVGGFTVAGLTGNSITGFDPNQAFGTESNNGHGDDWVISYSIKDLAGVVTGVTADVPSFAYGPGTLEMYVVFASDTSNFINFMDIAVTGGGTTGVGTILTGTADFTDVDASFNDLFHSGVQSCNGSDSFYDIWNECGDNVGESMTINFTGHFDTGVHASDFTNNNDGTFTLTSSHDGSGTFDIPEPASLALFGLGLLGLGFTGRKKSA